MIKRRFCCHFVLSKIHSMVTEEGKAGVSVKYRKNAHSNYNTIKQHVTHILHVYSCQT